MTLAPSATGAQGACINFLTSFLRFSFLLVTGDDKWVSRTLKRQWLNRGEPGILTPEPERHRME